MPQTHAPSKQFDVVSIKPTKAAYSGGMCRGKDTIINPLLTTPPPLLGTCVFNGTTLRDLVRWAYASELSDGIPDLVVGGPPWAGSDRFDVQGKSAEPERVPEADLNEMLQALLADRFKLRLHRDHKDVQGYALVVAKNGPKLKLDTSGDEHGSFIAQWVVLI